MRIKPIHIDQLKRHGYAIVPNFLTPRELAAARKNFLRYAPTARELAAAPERYSAFLEDAENLQTEFPFAGDALNHISTHPEIIAFAQHLLQTPNVVLSQSAIWAKYAGTGDFEQGLHLDYQGNTLVVPRDDGDFRQINMILYYSDVGMDMGPTYVVSREKSSHLPIWPPFRPRAGNTRLYKHERPVLARAGDMLIFSMLTFHRASAIAAKSGARFTHHLVYRSAAHAFAGYHLWSHLGERPELAAFLAKTTPLQRQAIGFPPPGHPYWNRQTLAAVALRYPKMDMRPYLASLHA